MAKKKKFSPDEKQLWFIGIGGNEINGVKLFAVKGTSYEVKKYLVKLAKEDQAEDKEAFDDGTKELKDVSENKTNGRLDADNRFSGYHIDYTAIPAVSLESEYLNDKKNGSEFIVGIYNNEGNGISFSRCIGTVQDIKKYLVKLVKEDRDCDRESWDSGSTAIKDIDECENKTRFDAWGTYYENTINYTAKIITETKTLRKAKPKKVTSITIGRNKINSLITVYEASILDLQTLQEAYDDERTNELPETSYENGYRAAMRWVLDTLGIDPDT